MAWVDTIKEIIMQDILNFEFASVLEYSITDDRSTVYVKVKTLPDEREIIAKMMWNTLGNIELPSKDDLVVVGYIDNNIDDAFIFGTLNNNVDKIPIQSVEGDRVSISLPSKKNWIVSDTRINLARGEQEPQENLVLGQALKTYLVSMHEKIKELSDAVSTHTHIGNVGAPTSPPKETADFVQLGADFDTIKSDNVENDTILSDLSFTEK